jgi:O-antigen ligase
VWGGMFSSHNMFLEILLQGGLFSFLLFIAITWLGIKRNMKSPIWLSNTAFLAIFCMLLKGLMETSIPTFYYVIITIAYDAPYLVKQYNERREDIVST